MAWRETVVCLGQARQIDCSSVWCADNGERRTRVEDCDVVYDITLSLHRCSFRYKPALRSFSHVHLKLCNAYIKMAYFLALKIILTKTNVA